ncbi:MAG: hypothetical protein E4H14_20385, partial [Candidatus Thorarchaeota archaeon]
MMIEKRGILFIGLVFIILLTCQPIGVQAHTPESMTLEYDWEMQLLTINVVHNVTDPLSHYISEIIVWKNNFSCVVAHRYYENQTGTEGMVDTFEITAEHGDSLSATAKCVISGLLHEYIIVTNPSMTDSSTTSTTDTATTSSSGPS